MNKSKFDSGRLDRVVADARAAAAEREKGYRERALKMYPWICGRCAREFTRANLQELTVHHRNHNHDDNPADGSNWELLCIYCHENEHARFEDSKETRPTKSGSDPVSTHRPLEKLGELLKKKDE